MFVSPRAMPSLPARFRCVMRESCSTASSNLRSRRASMSMSGLLTCVTLNLIGLSTAALHSLHEHPLRLGPVVDGIDADAVGGRHRVGGGGLAVEARLGC